MQPKNRLQNMASRLQSMAIFRGIKIFFLKFSFYLSNFIPLKNASLEAIFCSLFFSHFYGHPVYIIDSTIVLFQSEE